MKRAGWAALLLAAAGAGGCVTLPWAAPPPAVMVPAEPPPPPRPPVTPDEVNDANAGEVLRALQDELDRAGADRPAPRKPGPAPQRVEGGIE
jgi:hypothetical protein